MATQDSDQEEKYTRILITLIKGGTKLTCRFFEKRVAELTPADHATSPWTIYEFLLANKDNINKCKQDTGRNNKKLLFPGAPDKIQHTTWDFALFCFLLHELCDLSSAQRLDIEIIIKIRHKLAHATSPTLPDHRYNVYKQRIEVVFGRLLKEIGGADETFIKDIKQILELLNGAPLKLKDVIQEIHKAKLDNKKDMEIMARHMQRLETKVDMILDHMKIDRSKVKVADINVEITPTNCDNTTRASASSLMVTKMQLAVNTNPTSEQTLIVNDPDAEVDQAIGGIRENLESSGKHIVDVDYKCVMLTLRCHSLNILLALYNDSITGRLYQIFRPLEVALNQIIGFENVRLRVEIDEEELYTAIGNYVDVLEEFIMSPQVSEYLMQLEQDSQTEPAADTDVTQELLDHTPYGCSRDVASGKVSDWTNIEKVSVKEEFCKSQRSSEYLMELDKDSQTQPATDIGITPRSENIHNISRVQEHEPDGNITANTESANIDIFEPDNYAGLEVFKRPMCLVRISDDGQFEVDENILMQFRKIELPIVVVAVVGLCRTGKSYLMNCLAGQPGGGFPLGNTVEAKTKGILAWCKMHPVKLDTVILMLDSQGLGDIRKGNVSIDCKICTILALLCNVFVYNMMSALNRNFVEDLTFVSEIAKQIRERNTNITGEVENTEETSPTLVICLRDFCLLLEKSGKAVNANEYLEDSLRSKPGTDDRTQRYNQTRESIRKFFPKRKCFTFDRPGNVRTLKQLETVSLKEVSAKFYEDVLQFKSFVHECTPMVRSESRPINGQGE
ncbi:uncharacterized protein LOC128552018 [Mercenaria mercenaria]|uniref:uncharacterized protein LOC128552018 n=1 Tax=Mercenaria mercenaria TaxID=6596 RepID=UPI00234EC63C|nr:uncharacterized protein LOC128552018 [Mercenaria mercenaria]